jgi:Hypoxia induced protein conserved region
MSGKILVGFAVALVFAVLLAGLYTLWKGGDVAANWSNRLMRYRILAQIVAVAIILAVLYLAAASVQATPFNNVGNDGSAKDTI